MEFNHLFSVKKRWLTIYFTYKYMGVPYGNLCSILAASHVQLHVRLYSLWIFFFNLIVLGVTTDFTHKNGHSLWNLLVVECFQFSCLTIQVIWFYMISLTKSLIRPVIWHLFYLQKMVVPYGISYHLFYLRKRWLTIFTVALGTFSSV